MSVTERVEGGAERPRPAAADESSRAAALSRRREIPWLTLSAFLLSLVIAVINAYYAVRGSEMVVRPLEQVLLYRDGEGDNSVAVLSLSVQLINTASSEYGDVLLSAELLLDGGQARYPLQGEVEPVFTAQTPPCELGARCLTLPNLLLIERGNDIFDVPGGTARSLDLSFAVSPAECKGPASACQRYRGFADFVAKLGRRPAEVALEIRFNGDGKRILRCRISGIDPGYLRKVGWQSARCVESSVAGGGLL